MIKKLLVPVLFLLVLLSFFNIKGVHAEQEAAPVDNPMPEIQIRGKAAVLMEFNSGKIIYAKNEHDKLYPASMTKMMGMLLVLNAIKEGKLSFNEEVQVSASAAAMGGTQIFLQPGEVMIVEDLFKSVAINSANDAMFALAEKVGGSEPSFVKMMNDKAKKIGMKNTNFVNTVGFDDDNHYSTAYDMALLGKELLKHGDLVLKYTSQYDGYVRENTPNPFWLVNTNKLVKFYNGMDGLKTGFTSKAKYSLTATAKRNNVRFIAVSMCNSTIDDRSFDVTSLLNYGFAHYQSIKVYSKGEVITKIKVNDAKVQEVPVIAKDDIYVVSKKGEKLESLKAHITYHNNLTNKKANDVIGEIIITNADGWEANFQIITKIDIEQLTFWHLFFKTLNKLLF